MKSLFRFMFTLIIGMLYGLFFAQKTGKKFRADIRQSKTPYKTVLDEMIAVDKEAIQTLKLWSEESEDVQNLLKNTQKHMDTLIEKTKDLTEEAQEKSLKALEELAEKTKKSIADIKKSLKS